MTNKCALFTCFQHFSFYLFERKTKAKEILTVRAARSTLLRRRVLALMAHTTASKHRIVFMFFAIQLSLVNLEEKRQQTFYQLLLESVNFAEILLARARTPFFLILC